MNSDLSDIATALTGSVSSDGQTTISGQLKFPNGTAGLPSHTFANDLTTGMYYPGTQKLGFSAGGTNALTVDMTQLGASQSGSVFQGPSGVILQPVGIVQDFAGSSAPTGWFLCYGQVLAQASYPELFTVIGSTYNTGGEGAGNYRLPDCRDRTTIGKGNMGGVDAALITVAGGNFDATVLGGTGGAQNKTIGQANLPNVNFTNSGITVGNGTLAVAINASGDGANNNDPNNALLAGPATNIYKVGAALNRTMSASMASLSGSVSVTAQGTAASGGSGTALPIVQPTIVLNKIIFAGRP